MDEIVEYAQTSRDEILQGESLWDMDSEDKRNLGLLPRHHSELKKISKETDVSMYVLVGAFIDKLNEAGYGGS